MKTKLLSAGLLLCMAFGCSLRAGGQSWTLTSAPITNWASVACSADGKRLVAVVGGSVWSGVVGPIYLSTNAGTSWTMSGAPALGWSAVASSADGNFLVATDGGQPDRLIYISTNAGSSWISNAQSPSVIGAWKSVACSADGRIILAGSSWAAGEAYGGQISISTNWGSTWVTTYSAGLLTCVSCSADGRTMLVGLDAANPAPLAISTNAGASWQSASVSGVYSVGCSGDGSKMIGTGARGSGAVFSVDSGNTWEQVTAVGNSGVEVAISTEGGTMVATSYANTPNYVNVFVSHDSGVTWNSNILQTLNWAEASSAASSADGNTLVAVINGGGIYTWHAPGTVLWTYDAVGSGIFASPALAPDGTVYLATGAGLTAVTNAGSTGLNKWTGHSFGGSPSVGTDGTIYLANGSFLFAVNPDGSKKWSYPVQGGGTPAIGADGTIYLEGYFGLYAVTPSGSLKWQAQISGTGQYSSPVVGPDGTIYAASFEGVEVFAFNVDGSRKWVSNLVSGPLDAPALLPNGTLLVSAGALDAFGTDGTMLWSVGQSLGSAPVIGPANTVYVSSVYRDLLAVDPVSHKTLWDFVVSGVPQYGTVTTPAVDAQGSVYFCVSNSVWALSPAGLVQWSMTADQQPLANNDLANSSPVIGGDGTLYVAIGSKLYAIATGANGPANSSWPMYQQNARHTGKIERPFLEAPQQRTDTNFTFLLYPNQLGLTYTIESSTNLSTWTTVTNVLATTLPTEVIDLTASNAPTRFYRASVTTN